MKISNETLNEFLQLYEKEFAETLTPEEASEMARRILTLYEQLATRRRFARDIRAGEMT